jgi:hypothetical protein
MKDDRFSNFPQPTNNFSDTREVRDMPEVRDTPRSMQPKDQFSNQGYFDTFDSRQPGWQSAINHLQNYTDNQRGLALQEYHRRTYGVPEFNHGHRAATYAHQPFPAPLASTTRPPFGEAQQAPRLLTFTTLKKAKIGRFDQATVSIAGETKSRSSKDTARAINTIVAWNGDHCALKRALMEGNTTPTKAPSRSCWAATLPTLLRNRALPRPQYEDPS